MGTPTVTVIIPSYNRRAQTEKAVRSVLAQAYADLEVVVVDDASREEEVFFCSAVSDNRVRLVRHVTNQGAAAARNTGIKAAYGQIIAGLDSDDYWFPDKLASQMVVYEQAKDRDKVMVYSPYYWEQHGRWIQEPPDPLQPGEALSDYLFLRQGDIHSSSWLGSRALLMAYPSTELTQHEDWDMLLRMEAGGVRFVYCPTLAGVRAADLREDRLSTNPVKEVRELFLRHNIDRMTARSVVLWETVQAGGSRRRLNPMRFLGRQIEQMGDILQSPRLALPGRISLLFSYMASRIRNYILRKLRQRPARPQQD